MVARSLPGVLPHTLLFTPRSTSHTYAFLSLPGVLPHTLLSTPPPPPPLGVLLTHVHSCPCQVCYPYSIVYPSEHISHIICMRPGPCLICTPYCIVYPFDHLSHIICTSYVARSLPGVLPHTLLCTHLNTSHLTPHMYAPLLPLPGVYPILYCLPI